MSQASNNEDSENVEIEEQLSNALTEVENYKRELAATNSLLEEVEELVAFTWEQVESAEETALRTAGVADAAEERAYHAELELHTLEQKRDRQLFDQALELAVRKARRYERGLAILVFPRVEKEGEEERLLKVLRDSDLFGRIDESTYGVILEEDLPYHDIGECIERLSNRIGLPCASGIFGVDGNVAEELLAAAQEALEGMRSNRRENPL